MAEVFRYTHAEKNPFLTLHILTSKLCVCVDFVSSPSAKITNFYLPFSLSLCFPFKHEFHDKFKIYFMNN